MITKPILLIFPPFEGKTYQKSRFPFPTGLLYIAAYLEKQGIVAEVIDMSYPPTQTKSERPPALKGTRVFRWSRWGWTDEEIKKWFKKNLHKYHNIVGINSLMSTNYTGFYKVVDILKKVNSRIIIVAGGPHATVEEDHVFKNSEVDIICIGEGEEAFFEFLQYGTYHEALVDSVGYTMDRRGKRGFIKNMDILPFPKRHLLKDDRETKQMYVTFSRGCPHRCRFCGSYKIQGRKWRHKSVDRVIKEIEFYQKEWGVKTFIVEDDNATPGMVGIKHMKEICKRIIQKNLKTKFRISHGIPIYATANKELCDLMWEAGFREMSFPLESSDSNVLIHMGKPHSFNTYKKAIKNWSYEKNHPTETIIGYPFKDTIQTMLQTIIDITSQACISWPSHFRLIKGAPLFRACIKEKYIDPQKYDPIMAQDFCIETPMWTINDLREIRAIARAANYGIKNGFNIFTDNPNTIKDKFYFPSPPESKNLYKGKIIAEGNFGFNHGQSKVAEVLLSRIDGGRGRPVCTIKEKRFICFSTYKKSRVFFILRKMLKEK